MHPLFVACRLQLAFASVLGPYTQRAGHLATHMFSDGSDVKKLSCHAEWTFLIQCTDHQKSSATMHRKDICVLC